MDPNEINDQEFWRTSSIAVLEVSMDFEVGWGMIENGLWRKYEKQGVYENLRTILPRLLTELDAMEIPAIWATVGAMVEDPARHDFSHLPGGLGGVVRTALNEGRSRTFDGRDLFDQVFNSHTRHLLGGHSYSHTRFTYPGVDEEFVADDLQRLSSVFASLEFKPARFFVFPQNHEAYYNTIYDAGYTVVRGTSANSSKRDLWSRVQRSIIYAPQMSQEGGMKEPRRITESMYFNARRGRWYARLLPYIAAKRGLALAMQKHQVLHVWVHPHNLAENHTLLPLFLRFLRSACASRDTGNLRIGFDDIPL